MEYLDTDSPLRLRQVMDIGAHLRELVAELEPGEGFRIECEGRVAGALISARDLELYLMLLREYEDRLDIEAIEEAKAEGAWVPWEQLKARLGA